jgi:hypothetical protein
MAVAALFVIPAALAHNKRGDQRDVVPVPHPVGLNSELLGHVHSGKQVECRSIFRVVQRQRRVSGGRH